MVFRLSEHVALAGGFSYTYLNRINLDNLLQKLEGRNKAGWGGTASVMLNYERFSLGATYRSRIALDINGGTATGGAALAAVNPALVGATTSGSTKITLPDTVNLGLVWRPNASWLFSVDADWTNWKTFREVRIRYAPSQVLQGLNAALQFSGNVLVIPQNWRATWTLRAGMEWHFRPDMRAQIGYVFDQTPLNNLTFSPDIPDNDTHLFSAGYSVDLSDSARLDLAYTYAYLKPRDQVASVGSNAARNGRYKTDAHIVSGSLQYTFM